MPTCTHCGHNVNVVCESVEQAANCATLTDAYKTALRYHDWEYEFASHEYWRKGQQQRVEINKMQRLLDKDYEIWNVYAPPHYRR